MRKRIPSLFGIAAVAALLCLALTGCGIQDIDDDTRKTLGLALGLLVVAASGIGFWAQSNFFHGNRNRHYRQYRSRSNTKKRKRR